MTIDQVVVLVAVVAFVVVVGRGIRTQEAKDLVSLADRRRARRALGRVHRATVGTPPLLAKDDEAMTHDAR